MGVIFVFMMCNYCFIRRKTNYYLKICYFYTFFLNLYVRDTENFDNLRVLRLVQNHYRMIVEFYGVILNF